MKKTTPSVSQIETTNKAYTLREESQNDNELSESLGISKVTLYTRLKNHNWKKSEIALINILKPNTNEAN